MTTGNLVGIDLWLDDIRGGPAGAHLRHVERILHDSKATPAQWRALSQASQVALVQRVFDIPRPVDTPDSVMLHPLTGRHGKTWLLTPTASHDAALALCRASTLDTVSALRDSVMWIPVH